jgi:hypothetical protein
MAEGATADFWDGPKLRGVVRMEPLEGYKPFLAPIYKGLLTPAQAQAQNVSFQSYAIARHAEIVPDINAGKYDVYFVERSPWDATEVFSKKNIQCPEDMSAIRAIGMAQMRQWAAVADVHLLYIMASPGECNERSIGMNKPLDIEYLGAIDELYEDAYRCAEESRFDVTPSYGYKFASVRRMVTEDPDEMATKMLYYLVQKRDRPVVVIVSGNIGAGKSTLLRAMAAKHGFDICNDAPLAESQ